MGEYLMLLLLKWSRLTLGLCCIKSERSPGYMLFIQRILQHIMTYNLSTR
jgi:hypothetical protein